VRIGESANRQSQRRAKHNHCSFHSIHLSKSFLQNLNCLTLTSICDAMHAVFKQGEDYVTG
jgi:hypothetical protein